jgi:hypothetical protein
MIRKEKEGGKKCFLWARCGFEGSFPIFVLGGGILYHKLVFNLPESVFIVPVFLGSTLNQFM